MRYSQLQRQAYGRGIRTAEAGGTLADCPYDRMGILGHAWYAGFSKGKPRHQPDATDTAYEDQCAAACGL